MFYKSSNINSNIISIFNFNLQTILTLYTTLARCMRAPGLLAYVACAHFSRASWHYCAPIAFVVGTMTCI